MFDVSDFTFRYDYNVIVPYSEQVRVPDDRRAGTEKVGSGTCLDNLNEDLRKSNIHACRPTRLPPDAAAQFQGAARDRHSSRAQAISLQVVVLLKLIPCLIQRTKHRRTHHSLLRTRILRNLHHPKSAPYPAHNYENSPYPDAPSQ